MKMDKSSLSPRFSDESISAVAHERDLYEYESIEDETYHLYASKVSEVFQRLQFQCKQSFTVSISRFICEYRAWETTQEALRAQKTTIVPQTLGVYEADKRDMRRFRRFRINYRKRSKRKRKGTYNNP